MEGGGFPVIIGEKTWTLSDCSKQIQAKHTAWLKGRLRQEQIGMKADGIITPEECADNLRELNEQFACGEYSFGQPHWRRCMGSRDATAKLYQLLLEKEHPETKDWQLQEVVNLIESHEEGFTAALGDILPKALAGLGMKTKVKEPAKS